LVGLSLDVPKDLHDHYRKEKGEEGFDQVFRAARLLKKHRVNFAVLSCVNRLTAKQPLRVCCRENFCKAKCRYLVYLTT
jgi:uncharacterized protein